MALPNTVTFSKVLELNDQLVAELENKDERIEELCLQLLTEQEKNAKLSYQLQALELELEEIEETRERNVLIIDLLFCSACLGLGTGILVLLYIKN